MATITSALLEVKIAATNTIVNLQPLLSMATDFQADEADIQNEVIRIGLKYEFSATELQALVDLSQQMTDGPPTYGDPQAQLYASYTRALELHILALRAHQLLNEGVELLGKFLDVAMQVEDDEGDDNTSKLEEAKRRANELLSDIKAMVVRTTAVVRTLRPEGDVMLRNAAVIGLGQASFPADVARHWRRIGRDGVAEKE